MDAYPNVLCISIDSLRADYCSLLSDGCSTTPNLAALADKGTVYQHTISPSTWTLPVHISVFTGLYPPEHQVLDKGVELGDHPTFAELFKDVGYETKSFGWNGWLEQGGVLRGFTHYRSPEIQQVRDGVMKYYDHARNKISKLTFRHRLRDTATIENVQKQISGADEPFCYFVHLNVAHWPYHPPAPDHKAFSDRSLLELSWNFLQQRRLYERRTEIYMDQFRVSDRVVEGMRELYRGCVHYCDRLVGQLFDSLSNNCLEEQTIVIVFGDHGDNIGDEGLFGHHFSVADSVVRVPLLIFDPTGQLEPDEISTPVQLTDIYPTLLNICRVEHPETRSFSLVDEEYRDAAYVYYSTPPSFIDRIEGSCRGQLPETERYAVWKSPTDRLTWLPNSNNVSQNGNNSDSDALLDQLRSHKDSLVSVPPRRDSSLSEDIQKNLKQMGYI